MVRRSINSFGTITLPIEMRREMGIDGVTELWVDVRTTGYGEKEIVLRKSDVTEDILKKYKVWAEVIARIAESTVAIVWNGRLVSMSSDKETQSFIGKCIGVSKPLSAIMQALSEDYTILREKERKRISFLPNGDGYVKALYKILDEGDSRGFFAVLGGTRYDRDDIMGTEMDRRFFMIKDIVSAIVKKD